MNNHSCDFRELRLRHLVVIAAFVAVIGPPLTLVQTYLFGPSERLSSFLLARFALSPDMLTALTMAAVCLNLAFWMLVGHRFLRRFLC